MIFPMVCLVEPLWAHEIIGQIDCMLLDCKVWNVRLLCILASLTIYRALFYIPVQGVILSKYEFQHYIYNSIQNSVLNKYLSNNTVKCELMPGWNYYPSCGGLKSFSVHSNLKYIVGGCMVFLVVQYWEQWLTKNIVLHLIQQL